MDTFQHIRLQSIRVITHLLTDGKVVYVFLAIFSRDTYQYVPLTPEKSRGQTTNRIAERCAEERLQTSDARAVAFCYFADYASDTTWLSGHTLTGWLGLVVCPREIHGNWLAGLAAPLARGFARHFRLLRFSDRFAALTFELGLDVVVDPLLVPPLHR